MALDRDTILADNLRESLNLYQRSLVWAMTASSTFFVLTLSLCNPELASVSVLYGQLSGAVAWAVALGLSFVLGILAASALKNAETVLDRLNLASEVVDALLLHPSLATNANGFVRIGAVAFSPLTVLIAFGLELWREAPTSQRDLYWWLGLLLFILVISGPYVVIALRLGSRFKLPQPASGGDAA